MTVTAGTPIELVEGVYATGVHATLRQSPTLMKYTRLSHSVRCSSRKAAASPWVATRRWHDRWATGALMASCMHKFAPWQPGATRTAFPP